MKHTLRVFTYIQAAVYNIMLLRDVYRKRKNISHVGTRVNQTLTVDRYFYKHVYIDVYYLYY